MTNAEIIFKAAVLTGVYTEQEAAEYLQTLGCLPLKTFNEWKKRGYKVKKGEHAVLKTAIWMPKTGKADTDKKADDEESEENDGFYQKVACFFKAEQVELAKAQPFGN